MTVINNGNSQFALFAQNASGNTGNNPLALFAQNTNSNTARLGSSPGLPADYGTIDTVNALDASRLGLGFGNGGTTATSSAPAKAGTDDGGPFAIDWFGNGTAVTGNAGLVNAPAAGATPLGGAIGQQNADAVSGNWIQDWAVRGALIILGFIFVGVGLNMFGRAGATIAILSDGPANAARKAGKVATEAA